LLLIFVAAFFELTWSLRQFNLLLPAKGRAGQVVRMARMNCLGDLYARERWGWTSL
jgi:uncharacterized membrane protein